MNPYKRLLPANLSIPKKKFRRNTHLEDLSNELLFEVFDYLDGCDIHAAFRGLNHRFNKLVFGPSLKLKMNLSSTTDTRIERSCREVIIPNEDRVLSLRLSGSSVIDQFFNHCLIDSSFTRLESVNLYDVSVPTIFVILSSFNSLPCLRSLTVALEEDYYYNLTPIYRLIFRLPHLKYLKLSTGDYDEHEALIPLSINEKPSTIERLIIKHPCTIDEISSLLLHTPALQYLACAQLTVADDDQMITKNDQSTLVKLRDLSIDPCNVDFDQFEIFLRRISDELQSLRIEIVGDPTYSDGYRWKRLLKRHMPHSSELYIDLHLLDDDYFFADTDGFLSSFWAEKNMSFRLNIDSFVSILSISPKKETWYNNYLDRKMSSHSNNSADTTAITQDTCPNSHDLPIELKLDSDVFPRINEEFINQMKSSSMMTASTHLTVDYQNSLAPILIEIIGVLPNLHSLEIISMPSIPANLLSSKASELFSSVSNMNRISKVKLDEMKEIEQIYFLMDLCPQMEYLEINCKTEQDVIHIVTFVARNSLKHMRYLRFLRLSIPNLNEILLQNLRIIINLERPFYCDPNLINCEIYHVQNKIFIDWKV